MSQSRIILPGPSKLFPLGYRRSNHPINLRILMQNLFDWQLGTQQKPAPPIPPRVTEWSAPPFGEGNTNGRGMGTNGWEAQRREKILFQKYVVSASALCCAFFRGQFCILRVPALCEPCTIFAPPPQVGCSQHSEYKGMKRAGTGLHRASDRGWPRGPRLPCPRCAGAPVPVRRLD